MANVFDPGPTFPWCEGDDLLLAGAQSAATYWQRTRVLDATVEPLAGMGPLAASARRAIVRELLSLEVLGGQADLALERFEELYSSVSADAVWSELERLESAGLIGSEVGTLVREFGASDSHSSARQALAYSLARQDEMLTAARSGNEIDTGEDFPSDDALLASGTAFILGGLAAGVAAGVATATAPAWIPAAAAFAVGFGIGEIYVAVSR